MEVLDMKEIEMANADKTNASAEAWETGRLGQEEAHVAKAGAAASKGMDEALDLQLISIRLPKKLINDLKIIGKLEGIGYQPLIRQLLMRFVTAEKKRVLQDALASTVSEEKAQAKGDKRREKKAA